MALQFPHSGNPVSGRLQDPSVSHCTVVCSQAVFCACPQTNTQCKCANVTLGIKFSLWFFLANLVYAPKYTWHPWKPLDITSWAKNTEALTHLFHQPVFSFHFSKCFECFNQVFKWNTLSAGKKDTSDTLKHDIREKSKPQFLDQNGSHTITVELF